jgi:hypothetical protein
MFDLFGEALNEWLEAASKMPTLSPAFVSKVDAAQFRGTTDSGDNEQKPRLDYNARSCQSKRRTILWSSAWLMQGWRFDFERLSRMTTELFSAPHRKK